MSYGEVYRLEYRDQLIEGQNGRLTTVKILRKNYSGLVTEIKGSGDPVIFTASTDGDYLFEQIMSTSVKINLLSETNFQYLDIFSASARKHKVEIWKEPTPGQTQELFWCGYVLPDNYIEPLHYHKDYIVSIEAVDGLGRLSDIDFLNDAGNAYNGKDKAITVIRNILSKTGLELDIDIALSFDEIYSTTENVPALVTKYLDYATFYTTKMQNCEYVLKQILQSFGARIYQNKGRWIIKEATKNARGTHRVYRDIAGGSNTFYDYDATRNYSRTIGNNRLIFVDHEGDLQINPAFKKFTINHDFLKKKSILNNNDFEFWEQSGIFDPTPSNPDYLFTFANWTQTPASERFLEPLKLNDDTYCLKFKGLYSTFNSSYYIVSDPIQISIDGRDSYFSLLVRQAHFVSYFEVTINGKWVNADGELQTTAYRHPISIITAKDPTGDFGKIELNIKGTTESGDLVIKIYRPFFSGTPNQTPRPFFHIDGIVFKYLDESVTEDIQFEVDVDSENNEVPDDIDSILGDVPNIEDRENLYLGTYWRLSDGVYIPTLTWRNSDGQESTILQLLAELILDTHYRPKKYLTGLKMKGIFDFDSALKISFLDESVFIPINLECSDKYCIWTGDFIEIPKDRVLGTETNDNYIVTEDDNYILV